MIHLIKDIWSWLTNQALSQLLILLLVALLLLCINVKYPIEFERTKVTVKDLTEIRDQTVYVIHTKLTEKGAHIELTTSSYFTKVEQHEIPQN